MRRYGAAALVVAVFISLFFFSNTALASKAGSSKAGLIRFENGKSVGVEIASSEEDKSVGLMYRERLEENTGMLFVFGYEEKYAFWMKNMNFALDMIWVDSSFRIVDITRNAEPCREERCGTYSPSGRAKYVIEVNSGFSESNGIKIGQRVYFG